MPNKHSLQNYPLDMVVVIRKSKHPVNILLFWSFAGCHCKYFLNHSNVLRFHYLENLFISSFLRIACKVDIFLCSSRKRFIFDIRLLKRTLKDVRLLKCLKKKTEKRQRRTLLVFYYSFIRICFV